MSERTIKGAVVAKWTSTDKYKDGWDRIFGHKEEPKCKTCGGSGEIITPQGGGFRFIDPCPDCKDPLIKETVREPAKEPEPEPKKAELDFSDECSRRIGCGCDRCLEYYASFNRG
jgi:hypothetical protein